MTDNHLEQLRADVDARVDELGRRVAAGELTVGAGCTGMVAIWDELGDMYDVLYPVTEEELAIDYCDFDDVPACANIAEGWYYSDRDGQWHEAERSEMTYKAYVLSPEMFREMFGELPPLPAHAFGGARNFKQYPTEWIMMLTIVMVLVLAAYPLPKVGACPSGYLSEAHWCTPANGVTPPAVPKGSDQCPSGWLASGNYCIESPK